MSHPLHSSHTVALPIMSETGPEKDGAPQVSDTRLFVQLLAFTGCTDPAPIITALRESGAEGAVYLNLNDPQGIAVMVLSEEPDFFASTAREMFLSPAFQKLQPLPEYTMFGRTYGTGRDPDLEDTLLHRPRRNGLNSDNAWAIWYPLRRTADFALLEPREQGKILFEHAQIGMAYGAAGLAKDMRLTCYGLDKCDNEFVIGLFGSDLHPLSRVVQDMRKTQQTARYISSLGPFFIGRVAWQSPPPGAGHGRR